MPTLSSLSLFTLLLYISALYGAVLTVIVVTYLVKQHTQNKKNKEVTENIELLENDDTKKSSCIYDNIEDDDLENNDMNDFNNEQEESEINNEKDITKRHFVYNTSSITQINDIDIMMALDPQLVTEQRKTEDSSYSIIKRQLEKQNNEDFAHDLNNNVSKLNDTMQNCNTTTSMDTTPTDMIH